ncbi:DUF6098 family protein, partial [Georgenia sp. 10Sc9-8]|nr:DUF6098 family protein [Georgenia halotolerans]
MTTLSIPTAPRRSRPDDRPDDLPTLDSLDEVVQTQRAHEEVFLRVSPGPWADLRGGGRDPESGYLLPGIPARPLRPEAWWAGAPDTWVARQLAHHSYRMCAGRLPWLL